MGPRKSVRYSREGLWSKVTIWEQKSGVIFVHYNRDFVMTMIFDCILPATEPDREGFSRAVISQNCPNR